MTNFLEKLKELRDKATPGLWKAVSDLPAYAVAADGLDVCPSISRLYRQKDLFSRGHWGVQESDAELIAEMRNSLDLWLELAEEVRGHISAQNGIGCSGLEKALAKLRGEHE